MSDAEPTGSIGSKDDDRGIDTEQDVPVDDATAASRATGEDESGESPGTTGTGGSGEYVGRVSGDDEGYARPTGAEARAVADSDSDSDSDESNRPA